MKEPAQDADVFALMVTSVLSVNHKVKTIWLIPVGFVGLVKQQGISPPDSVVLLSRINGGFYCLAFKQ